MVGMLRATHEELSSMGVKTIPVAGEAEVDFAAGVVRYDGREFAVSVLSPTAQELVLAGGSEGLVRQRLAESS